MQTSGKFKKQLKMLLGGAAIVYFTLGALNAWWAEKRYRYCDDHTQRLNGKVVEYANQKYKVVLCGNGGNSNQNDDRVRMQIFSEKGALLAERKFTIDWDTNMDKKIVYQKDHLIYFDASEGGNYQNMVSMPPTMFDWMRAHIPLAN